jgi:ankyrin repeat protein
MYACQQGYILIVRELLNKGANVNKINNNGWSALMIACYNGYTDIVKDLLNEGVDVNVRNVKHETALDITRSKNYQEIITLLENYRRRTRQQTRNNTP